MPDFKRSSEWGDSRFRQLVETAFEGILTTDADGRIAFANHRAAELTGYDEDELLGMHFSELYLPEGRTDAAGSFERRKRGLVEQREVMLCRKDGGKRWVLVSSSPLLAPDGSFSGALGLMSDITARRVAEQELAETAIRLRLLNAALTDLAGFAGPTAGLLDRCAEHALSVCGADGASVILLEGESVVVAGSAGNGEKFRGAKGRADKSLTRPVFATGQPYLAEDTHSDPLFTGSQHESRSVLMIPMRADGRIIGVLLAGSTRPHAFGARDVGNLHVLGEVTAALLLRRQAVEQMTASEEQYRLLFQHHPKPMWVYDVETLRFLAVNEAAIREYGWTESEFLKMTILQIRPPEDVDQVRRVVKARAIPRGTQRPNRHLHRDGSVIWVEITSDEITFNGHLARLVASNNVTTRIQAEEERARLEQQFLRAQRLESIGTLAGGIAHDLNNVLVPIMLCLDLLKDEMQAGKDDDLIETAITSAKRGAAMVHQLLTFARGVEGHRGVLQVRHLIRDIEAIVRETFPKNISVRSAISKDLSPVVGDATQLHQVLLNLVVNARDAMPEGGELHISAEDIMVDAQHAAINPQATVGRHIVIRVSDTGPGIPSEHLQKVFDPFFTTKGHGKGTGLGLSTSQAIVRNHGGFIHVYSEPGRGARFHVYLPIARDGEVADADTEVPFVPRGNGELVLLVDDEDSIRRATRRTLEAFGYRVLTAMDGADALATFLQNRDIAVVVTDMMMPVMDGYALIIALRRFNPDIRVIATSGVNAEDRLQRVSGEGVRHFLSKPYTAEALLTMLHDLLVESTSEVAASATARS